MKQILICVLACVLALGLAPIAVAEEAAPAAAPEAAPAPPPPATEVGAAVADWTAKAADSDKMTDSKSLAGPYALVFVNSSCAACRAELSALTKMEYQGLDIFIVSTDFNPKKSIRVYRDALKLTYPLLNGSDFGLADRFGFSSTPATVIVKDKKVLFRQGGFGARDKEALIAEFSKYKK